MLEQMQQLGSRLVHLFGEPDNGSLGISKRLMRDLKDSLSAPLLAQLLPYEWYDEKHQLFLGKNSLGFGI